MAANEEISVRINVDVSEALTGLKAIQREAKKTTQALRELESEESNGISSFRNTPQVEASISTADIIAHLKYWNISNLKHEIDNGNLGGDMTIYNAIKQSIKGRRAFYLDCAEDEPKLGTGELAHIAEIATKHHKGEVILTRKQAEKFMEVKRPDSLGPIKAPTDGHSDVGEIARKLVEKIRGGKGGERS